MTVNLLHEVTEVNDTTSSNGNVGNSVPAECPKICIRTGGGKTLIQLESARYVHEKYGHTVIIVTTASGKSTYHSQIKKFGLEIDKRALFPTSTVFNSLINSSQVSYIVTSHRSFRNAFVPSSTTRKYTLILDECHLANPNNLYPTNVMCILGFTASPIEERETIARQRRCRKIDYRSYSIDTIEKISNPQVSTFPNCKLHSVMERTHYNLSDLIDTILQILYSNTSSSLPPHIVVCTAYSTSETKGMRESLFTSLISNNNRLSINIQTKKEFDRHVKTYNSTAKTRVDWFNTASQFRILFANVNTIKAATDLYCMSHFIGHFIEGTRNMVQLIGRGIRLSNPNNDLKLYFICQNSMRLKLKLYLYFENNTTTSETYKWIDGEVKPDLSDPKGEYCTYISNIL